MFSFFYVPKGGRGLLCLMSLHQPTSHLESQGYYLVPLSCLAFLPSPLALSNFSANGPFSWLFSGKFSNNFCLELGSFVGLLLSSKELIVGSDMYSLLPHGIGICHYGFCRRHVTCLRKCRFLLQWKTDFCCQRKRKKKERIICRSKKSGLQKKEALILALQKPTKHSECVHMWLSPVLVALIQNTATCCYSPRQALALNTVIPTCFCTMFWQRKMWMFW